MDDTRTQRVRGQGRRLSERAVFAKPAAPAGREGGSLKVYRRSREGEVVDGVVLVENQFFCQTLLLSTSFSDIVLESPEVQ